METLTIAEQAIMTFYARQNDYTGVNIPLQEFFEGVVIGRWKTEAEYIREVADNKEEKSRRKKFGLPQSEGKGLPGLTIPGTFKDFRRGNCFDEPSGIIGLDFDGLGDDISTIQEKLKKDPYSYAVFQSISGKGLCALVRVESQKWSEGEKIDKWKETFESLESYYLEKYKLVVDTGTKDVTRLRYVTFDPGLYVNEKAIVWKKLLKKKPKSVPEYTPFIHTGRDIEFVINQIERDRIDLTSSYDQWFKIGFALISEYGENARSIFHRISQFHPDYDPNDCDKTFSYLFRYGSRQITIGTFYYYAKLAGVQLFSPRTKEVVRVASMYKRQASTPQSAIEHLAQMENIPPEESQPIVNTVFSSREKFQTEETFVDEIELYLKQSHPMRFNELTRQFESPEGQVLIDKDFYRIYFETKKALGEKVTFNEVNMLIHSHVTAPTYHPIKEFFTQNKHRNETGLIKKWAETINTDTGLESGDFTPDYAYRFLRKWLIGLVANVYSDDICPLVPILTGKKGTGKSEFFWRTLPDELKNYHVPSTWQENKDEQILMGSSLICYNDEFKTKGGKLDIEYFRSLATVKYFTVREVYARKPIRIKRIASLAGSSNPKEIIQEAEHNRRIIPINVLSIDFDAFNAIDKVDLLMEAYHAYKAGERHELTYEEMKMLDELTTSFHKRTFERQMIDEYLTVPTGKGGEMTEWLSPLRIMLKLEMHANNRKMSETVFGRELQAAGFERTRRSVNGTRPWGYEVVINT